VWVGGLNINDEKCCYNSGIFRTAKRDTDAYLKMITAQYLRIWSIDVNLITTIFVPNLRQFFMFARRRRERRMCL